MAAPVFDRESAAAILLDALLRGDAKAAAHWGVTVRTIQRYRRRMGGDELLSQAVAQKGQRVRAEIGERLELAVASTIEALAELVRQAEPGDGVIHEVAGALKILVEAQVGLEVIRARTARVQRAA